MMRLPPQNAITLARFLWKGDRINRMLLLAERGAENSSSIEDSIFVERMQDIMGQAPDTALDIIKKVVMLSVVAMFLAFTVYLERDEDGGNPTIELVETGGNDE